MWLKALRSTTSASLPLPIFFVFPGWYFCGGCFVLFLLSSLTFSLALGRNVLDIYGQ